jgi:hypothetical protein
VARSRKSKVPRPLARGMNDMADISADELEFLRAVDAWRTRTGVRFPVLRDLLAILKELGYTKPGANQ